MRFVRRRGMVAHSLCFAVVLAWTNAGRAEEPAGRALTGAELEALERGELVTRALRQQRGNQLWFGGSSWQVIDAPPSTVWQALHDTARYPQMLPRVSQAQLVAGGGFDRVVCIEQRAWPIVASYCVHLRSDARAAELDFELDETRPHSIEGGHGFLRVLPYGSGRTLLVFGMLADTGRSVLAWFARGTIQTWMLKLPWTIKRYLDRRGSARYVPA